ncbi:hypothetical protein ACVWWO_000398 [Bradyrhizobium sp. F1.13.1]
MIASTSRCPFHKVLFGPGSAKLAGRGEDSAAMTFSVVPLLPVQVPAQQGGGRTDPELIPHWN